MGPGQYKYAKNLEVGPPFRGFVIAVRFTPASKPHTKVIILLL